MCLKTERGLGVVGITESEGTTKITSKNATSTEFVMFSSSFVSFVSFGSHRRLGHLVSFAFMPDLGVKIRERVSPAN